jgi:hypothetical protein
LTLAKLRIGIVGLVLGLAETVIPCTAEDCHICSVSEPCSGEVLDLGNQAAKGDREAQLKLADHYQVGDGVKADDDQALRLYEMSLIDSSDKSVDSDIARFEAQNQKHKSHRRLKMVEKRYIAHTAKNVVELVPQPEKASD